MLTNDVIANLWRFWVNTVGGLGLPFDRQATAVVALVFLFYGIGAVFKLLTSK